MDTTQLLLSAAATVGVALVGLMAVVPPVLEAQAVRGHLDAPPPAAPARRPGRRRHHRAAPLAL